jgi:hypothetical protein
VNGDSALGGLGEVLVRAPFEYATSWPIDALTVVRDGAPMDVLVKRFERLPTVKPAGVLDPEREAAAYRLLARAGFGSPRLLASGAGWIALEKLDGEPLWQRADLGAWRLTARWAARLHCVFGISPPRDPHLLRHSPEFYNAVLNRACALAGDPVEALRGPVEHAIALLCSLQPTLIHGELYPANVLVTRDGIAAVDWEMAAIGPGVIDLAALVSGWDPGSTAAIVAAYGDTDPVALAAARLVLALQWLGWSDAWKPPAEHRRDWLAEAQEAAGAMIEAER